MRKVIGSVLFPKEPLPRREPEDMEVTVVSSYFEVEQTTGCVTHDVSGSFTWDPASAARCWKTLRVLRVLRGKVFSPKSLKGLRNFVWVVWMGLRSLR